VPDSDTAPACGEDASVVAAVRAGDEWEFAALVERHRAELRVHCYRLLGNVEDAEDLVQETFAKAWRSRASFEGRSTLRAWLYRIATNASLDAIKRSRRRVLVVEPERSVTGGPMFDEVPWLQPIPDGLLDAAAPSHDEPEAVVVATESIELAFLAAIQHLPARQRAVLVLRDLLGWSARETADALDATVVAVNGALRRARARLQQLGRPDSFAPGSVTRPSAQERDLLRRYMDAHARADAAAIVELLGDDVRFSMPPWAMRYDGRDEVAAFFHELLGPGHRRDWRLVPTRANRQPAAANYVRDWADDTFRAVTLDVLRIEHGELVEITTFDARVFPAFGLPATL
jgi:RNA polymerase sigma-70 factor (ECF subfamily)